MGAENLYLIAKAAFAASAAGFILTVVLFFVLDIPGELKIIRKNRNAHKPEKEEERKSKNSEEKDTAELFM